MIRMIGISLLVTGFMHSARAQRFELVVSNNVAHDVVVHTIRMVSIHGQNDNLSQDDNWNNDSFHSKSAHFIQGTINLIKKHSGVQDVLFDKATGLFTISSNGSCDATAILVDMNTDLKKEDKK